MSLGIHSFVITDGPLKKGSFFIERSYGNYLVFPTFLSDQNHNFIKSKGGVWKQIYTSENIMNIHSGEIFRKYGAYIVMCGDDKDYFTEYGPVEFLGKSFYDSDLIPLSFQDFHSWIILKQNGKNFLIPDEHLLLKDNSLFWNSEFRLNEKDLERIKSFASVKIEAILFSECLESNPYFQTYGKPISDILQNLEIDSF